MNVFIALVLALLFLVTPFRRGLFFDQDFYFIHMIVFTIFMVWGIKTLIKKERVPYLYYSIFLIPLTFLMSLFIAESPKGGFDNLFRWLDYSALFILLVSIAREERIKSLIPYVFVFQGILLTIFALLGYYKLVDYPDNILIDHLGNERFTSVFQYGNTFATVLGAFWLFSLIWMTDRENSFGKMSFLALPMALYALDFFHTYSRGGLLIFPVAWLVGLLILPFNRQVLLVVYTLISTASGLLIFNELKESSLLFVLFVSLITSFLMVFISSMDKRYGWKLDKINSIRLSSLFLTFAALICAALLFLDITNKGMVYQSLPASFQARVSDISLETYSVQGRSLFFDDALQISEKHPILGVGGEGWRVLFTHIQQVPYWSNESHNGYLEVLLNTGWLGLIIFILVFGYLFFLSLRNLRAGLPEQYTYTAAAIPALIMIFAHSFIDFNFSFGTVWYIILVLFIIAFSQKQLQTDQAKQAIHHSLQSVVLLFVGVFLFYSFNFYSAVKVEASIYNSDDIEAQVEKLLRKNPYDVEYQNTAADIYMQLWRKTKKEEYKVKVINIVSRMEKLEPNNSNVMTSIGMRYIRFSEEEKAITYLDKALEFDHYNVGLYKGIAGIKSDLMQVAAVEQQDQMKAKEYSASLLKDYKTMINWNKKMLEHPVKINERNFHIPSAMKIYAGEALLVQHKYQDLVSIVGEAKDDQDEKIRKKAQALLTAGYQLSGSQAQAEAIKQMVTPSDPDFNQLVERYLYIGK